MEQNTKKERLRRWELALLAGVAVAILAGLWLNGEQQALADRVIRLHVIANSDSEEDQALKLMVRDRVLEVAESLYRPEESLEEAYRTLEEHLPALAAAGREALAEQGSGYPVSVSLEET